MFVQPSRRIWIDSRRIPVARVSEQHGGGMNKRSNLPGEVSSMSTPGELDNLHSQIPEVPTF